MDIYIVKFNWSTSKTKNWSTSEHLVLWLPLVVLTSMISSVTKKQIRFYKTETRK